MWSWPTDSVVTPPRFHNKFDRALATLQLTALPRARGWVIRISDWKPIEWRGRSVDGCCQPKRGHLLKLKRDRPSPQSSGGLSSGIKCRFPARARDQALCLGLSSVVKCRFPFVGLCTAGEALGEHLNTRQQENAT